MDQGDWLRQKVGSHLVLCCIHRMNWVNSRNASSMMTTPTVWPLWWNCT